MAFWSWFTGGGDTVTDIVDGAISGLDKAWYTSEEKDDFKFKIMDHVGKFVKDSLDESTVRSKTRRMIAVGLTGLFGMLVTMSAVFACMDEMEIVQRLVDIGRTYDIGSIMITIVIFYFGSYGLGKWQEKKNGD